VKRIRLAVVLATVLLAGCECVDVRMENRALREALERQEGAAMAEISRRERAASIAQACDWIVPVCPESVAAPGRAALADGYGVSRLSLGLTVLKVLVVLVPPAVIVGALTGATGWAWSMWSRPALARAEQARRLLARLEVEQARLQGQIEAAQRTLREVEALIESRRAEASRLTAEASRLREAVTTLEALKRGVRDL
jgi:hypothetical protein